MHWAFVYIRMGEELKAANNFRKSFALLKANREQYPDFEYNNIFYGLEEAAVGAIPDDYRWIATIFGMKGSIKKGMAKLESFVYKHDAQDPLYDDALIYYVYLGYYLQSRQEEVWQFMNSDKYPVQESLLLSFVKANIAINHRKSEVALSILKSSENNKQYKLYPVFDYEMGNALLHALDASAIRYYNSFLSSYKGQAFVKDSWQKIAWLYYMEGNKQKATESRNKIVVSGNALFDADKKAKRFAVEDNWPNMTLLQASLLIDGGYYAQALTRLLKKKESDFESEADKAEYYFRLGRVYDELQDDEKALLYYKYAISIGQNRKEHFAARAALQSGMIYERRKMPQMALNSYKSCLEMPVQDFKNSIKQQAKAGINRLVVR